MARSGGAGNTGRKVTVAVNGSANTANLSVSSNGIAIPGLQLAYNSSNSQTNSNWKSVVDQSGLFAGNGGFQLTVGGNTSLIGGVLASTADASKNSLTTTTFDFSNIQNSADYSAKTSGFSATLGNGKGTTAPSGFSSGGTSGRASSTTDAAVAAGTIVIRQDQQTGQDSTVGLSRDTANATNALGQIFDEEKVQENLQLGQEFSQLGMTVAGQIADQLQHSDPLTGKAGDAAWAEGGADRTALHAIVAAIGASLTGGNALAAAGGSVAGEEADVALQGAISEATKGLPKNERVLVEEVALNVVAGAAGDVIGGAIGGASGATSGSQYALAGDLYNRQLSKAEHARLAGLLDEKSPDEQKRMEAEACYIVECYKQISMAKDPTAYNQAYQLYLQGQGYSGQQQYQDELGKVQAALQTSPNLLQNGLDAVSQILPTAAQSTFLGMQGAADPLNPAGTGLCGLPGQSPCTIGVVKAKPSPQQVNNFLQNVLTPTSAQTASNFLVAVPAGEGAGIAAKSAATAFAKAVAEREALANLKAAAAAAAERGWKNADGSWIYPPPGGALGAPQREMLTPGEVIDRYGDNPNAQYFSPVGTPYDARALPPGGDTKPYVRLEILKPLPVDQSIVAPWFGEPGMGVQYQLPGNMTMQDLINGGYVKVLP